MQPEFEHIQCVSGLTESLRVLTFPSNNISGRIVSCVSNLYCSCCQDIYFMHCIIFIHCIIHCWILINLKHQSLFVLKEEKMGCFVDAFLKNKKLNHTLSGPFVHCWVWLT